MKKSIFALAAIGAITLASCSNDEMPAPAPGGDGNVTFAVKLPAALSRANSFEYGTGAVTKQLNYAVYDATDGTLVFASDDASTGAPAATAVDAKNFTLSLNLVKGKSYDFIFWADAATGSPYTFSSANKSVAVDYTGAVSNDENRDAFFQSVAGLAVSGPMQQSVELRRPFAQLNVGTSDIAAAAAAKTVVKDVTVTVKGVYSSLNLFSGIASDPKDVTFEATAMPGTAFTIDDVEYDYLAMDYLLTGTELEVEGNVQQAKRELMDASVLIAFTDGQSATVEVPNMPVQRNYRTNVYGALLTSPLDLTITVVPEFFEPDFNLEQKVVKTAEELVAALASPDVQLIEIPANIDLAEARVTQEELTFDQPKEIRVASAATVTLPADACFIANNGLTLKGEGTLTNETVGYNDEKGGTYRSLVHIYGGDLVIDGMNLVNDPTYHKHGDPSTHPYNSSAISYWNDANVTIQNARIISGEFTVCGMGRDVASGKITMTDSYFESTSANSNGTGNWAYAMRIFGTEAVLENCTVVGVQGGVSADSKGLVMTIKSGTYTTHNNDGQVDAHYPLYVTNGAQVIVEGGDFYSPNNRSGISGFDGTSALVSGDNDVDLPDGSIVVYGGKFSGRPYCHINPAHLIPAPEGYEFVLNEEADKDTYKWTVKKL